MAMKRKHSAAMLFNNSALSDVKLKHVYNGETREYHAHKAILCKESEFFMRAFLGDFKEATENIVELHDDEPAHFEFALRFMYTENYDEEALESQAASDKTKRVLVAIGVHTVADKYGIERLYEPTAEDVESILQTESEGKYDMMKAAIQGYCHTAVRADGLMGRTIASVLYDDKRDFTKTKDFEQMIQNFPVFGADIALEWHRRGMFSILMEKCRCTGTNFHRGDSTAMFCNFCKRPIHF